MTSKEIYNQIARTNIPKETLEKLMQKIYTLYDYQILYFDKGQIQQLKDILMLYNYKYIDGNMCIEIKSQGRLLYGNVEFGHYISEFNIKEASFDENSAFIAIIKEFAYNTDDGIYSRSQKTIILVFNPV